MTLSNNLPWDPKQVLVFEQMECELERYNLENGPRPNYDPETLKAFRRWQHQKLAQKIEEHRQATR